MTLDSLSGALLLAAIVLLLLLERLRPAGGAPAPLHNRWLSNLGLMLAGTITVGILFSSDLDTLARELPTGALRGLPLAAEALIVIVLLDGWRYFEHRVFHEIPLLWRAHLVHHSDTALDITTSQRHHPFETVLVTMTGMLLLFALGFSATSLAIYALLASLFALWTHSNTRLPARLDRALRRVIVTPAVHAVHHSDLPEETNSNYGTLFTLWDRAFGTYVDPDRARIPHIGLEYFHREADTMLGPVLLQPFEFRADPGFYPTRDDPVADRGVHRADGQVDDKVKADSAWRRAGWQLGLCGLACLAVLWPTVASLVAVWSTAETYQYAWLVIPALLYLLLAQHREQVLSLRPSPDYAGLALLLPGVVLWCAALLVDIQIAQHVALVVIVLGVLLSVLGRTAWLALFPAFAMLFMLVPAGDLLQQPLRDLTVSFVGWFATVFELPHSIEGYVAYVGEHRYVVIDACSGLTYVLMGGFLGYTLGLVPSMSLTRAVLLGLAGCALGVITNALRVWMILAVDWIQGSQLDMAGHTDLQWLALLACMGLLLYVVVRAGDRAANHGMAAAPNRRPHALAPVIAGVAVLAAGTVQALATVSPEGNRAAMHTLASLYPAGREAAPLNGEDQALIVPLDRGVDAVLVMPNAGNSRLHEQRFSPEDRGTWRHASTTSHRDCAGQQCVQFVHQVFRRKGSEARRHAFFAYFVGDTVTDSRLDYRIANGRNRLQGGVAPAGALGFRVDGQPPGDGTLALGFLQLHAQLQGRVMLAAH